MEGMFGRQSKRRCQGITFGCFVMTWTWWKEKKKNPPFVGNSFLTKKKRFYWEALKSSLNLHKPPRIFFKTLNFHKIIKSLERKESWLDYIGFTLLRAFSKTKLIGLPIIQSKGVGLNLITTSSPMPWN